MSVFIDYFVNEIFQNVNISCRKLEYLILSSNNQFMDNFWTIFWDEIDSDDLYSH